MDWRTIRISKSTLEGLQRYRDNLQVQVSANRVKFARFGPSFRVSLGEAIDYLLAQKDEHTKRGRKGFDAGGRAKDASIENEREQDCARHVLDGIGDTER